MITKISLVVCEGLLLNEGMCSPFVEHFFNRLVE